MTGTIRIRSGRAWNNNNRSDGARIGNWGKGTLIAGNIDVKSCELAIGDGWQQRGLIDVDINGDVTVRDGGRVYVSDWSLDADKLGFNPWEDGTLGNTWFIENGGQVDMYVWNTKNGEVPDDVVHVATKFEFVGGPGTPADYTWRIDHHEQGGWNNQNSLNDGYLFDVTMRDGARVFLTRSNINRDGLKMNMELHGDSMITRDDFSIMGITTPGGPAILRLGDSTGSGGDYDIDAALRCTPTPDTTLVLDNQESRLDVFNDLGQSKVVTHTAGHYMPGEDLKVRLYYGRDETIDEDGDTDNLMEAWGAGSTIEISGCGRIELWTDRNGSGNPANVNAYEGTVHIMDNVQVDPGECIWDAVLMAKNGGGGWNGSDPTIGWFRFVDADANGLPDLDGAGLPSGGIQPDADTYTILDRDNELDLDILVPHLAGGETRPIISSWDDDQFLRNVYGDGDDTNGLEELELVGHPENLGDGKRYSSKGIINGVRILWNSGDHFDLDPGTDLGGHGGIGSQPGEVRNIHAANGRIELWTDPGDGLISSYVAGEGAGGRNEKVYIFYGQEEGQDEDGDGNPLLEQWGEGTTIAISGGGRIEHRVRRVTGNVNEFLGTVRVMDDVEVVNDWDANLRSQNAGGPNNANDAFSIYSDVRVENGAKLNLQRDNVCVVDLNVEESGGHVGPQDGDRTFIRDITNISEVPGLKTITLGPGRNGNRHLRMIGLLDGDPGDDDASSLEVFWAANSNLHLEGPNPVAGQYADTSYVLPGFQFAGHGETLTKTTGGGSIHVRTDPGPGTINWMATPTDMMQIYYGRNNDDTVGETGWGDGLVINVGGNNEVNMRANKALVEGECNVNILNAQINVFDDVAGSDARIYADSDVNAPPGLSVNNYANVVFAPQDPGVLDAMPELRIKSFDGSRIRADFTLDETDALVRAGPGGGGQLYYIGNTAKPADDLGDGQDRALHIITNGWGEDVALDGTIGDETDLVINANGGGQVRITSPLCAGLFGGLDLNGRTIMVERGTGGGGRIGALVVMDDAPADIGTGTILVDGALHNDDAILAFQADHDGSGNEVNWANVDVVIQNSTGDDDAQVEGWVDTGLVGPVQTINQRIRVADQTTPNWDARDAFIDAEHFTANGESPGRVEFNNLEMGQDARAFLRASSDAHMPQLLVNPTATGTGRAAFHNDSSESRIFIGDVAYDGAGQTENVEFWGSQVNRFVGEISADVSVRDRAILEDGASVTGNLYVDSSTGQTVTLATDIDASNITVNGWSALTIALEGTPTNFAVDDLNLSNDAHIALATDFDLSDAPWNNDGAGEARILISKENYAGTLTLNAVSGDPVIGSDITDLASIASPIVGNATRLIFDGGDNLLTLDAGVIDEAGLGGGSPVAIEYSNDVRIDGAQTYNGGTTIWDGHVYVLNSGSLGSAAVGTAGGTMDLHADIANAVVLAGGGIYASGAARQVTGALSDAGDANPATVVFGADDTLTLTQNLTIKGPRTVDVTTGTVAFSGTIASDVGTWTVTKAGRGTLQLNGDASGINLVTGASPGGLTLVGAGGTPPASVVINAASAYGVEQVDHGYGEVDMANSTGALAIGASTNQNLTINNADLSLGAANDATYSGALTPNGTAYQLGGGGATLTVAAGSLTDQGGATDLQIGRTGTITMPGLLCNVYEGLGTDVEFPGWDAVDAATPTMTFTDSDGIDNDSFSAITGRDENGYTMTWTGHIEVHGPAATTYTFNGDSDDGGTIEVYDPGTATWVPVADTRNPDKFDGTITLDPGMYDFRAGFREQGGGDYMTARWDAGLLGNFEVIDGANDADALVNFFYDVPWSDFIDGQGMVVLEGEDATNSITGDINIYMDAGIVAKTGADDPFSAIDDAAAINVHETGTLDIGGADMTTAIAQAAIAKMTFDGGIARNGYGTHGVAIDADDLIAILDDTVACNWPAGTVVIGGGGGGAAETALVDGFDIYETGCDTLQKVGDNTLRLLAGAPNYIDYIIVDGGRVVAEDNDALGEAYTVTVNNDGEVQLNEDNADLLTEFVLNDQATLDLQGHSYTVNGLTLGTMANALLTGGSSTVLEVGDVTAGGDMVGGSGALTLDQGTTLKAWPPWAARPTSTSAPAPRSSSCRRAGRPRPASAPCSQTPRSSSMPAAPSTAAPASPSTWTRPSAQPAGPTRTTPTKSRWPPT